jgi:hypothetical protein
VAELWGGGALKGLTFSQSKGCAKVELHVDSKVVVSI